MELEKSLFKGASGEKTSLQHLAVAGGYTERPSIASPLNWGILTFRQPQAEATWPTLPSEL